MRLEVECVLILAQPEPVLKCLATLLVIASRNNEWSQLHVDTPYLLYENVAGALQFLAKAFGFRKNGCQMSGPDGKINHAAMQLGEDLIMMGYPGAKYKNPNGNDLGCRHGFRAQADPGAHPGNESGHDSAVPWRAARLLAGEGLKSERCTHCNFVLPSTVFNFLADEIRQSEPMQLAGFSSAHVDGNPFGDAQPLTR